MLEIELTGSDRSGNEAVDGAASETFTTWLHIDMPPSNCRRREGISFRRTIPCLTRWQRPCFCIQRKKTTIFRRLGI